MARVVHPVELPNGVTLQYVEQGDSSGIPVMLLHGATDSWRSFEPVLPHLPSSLRAFALTQRGHGDASRPPYGYRYADFAADLAAVMDVLGLESAVIVGHSMGRAIAQRFAIDYPERTLGLVLVGAFAGEAHNPAVVEIEEAVSTQVDPIDAGFAREFQLSTLAKPVPPAFLETAVEESRKVPVRVWREVFARIREDDVAAELGEIRARTLVITGDRDGFAAPDEVEARAQSVADARLVVYHGAGHALHWEEPVRFATDLIAFAEDLKSRSDPRTPAA
ncbi:MAG TPA: alpha/beta hydrolase [Longimicrobium sp.]|nr:alpha/beta hydrolase [Longimicrobium sp.]